MTDDPTRTAAAAPAPGAGASAASPSGRSSSDIGTSTAGASGGDWPVRAADFVDDMVSLIHDRVVRPLLLAARAAVFGILVGTMALVLAVLLAIAVVRLLDDYAVGHRAWAAEALVGGVLSLLGLFAWSKRRPRGVDRPER